MYYNKLGSQEFLIVDMLIKKMKLTANLQEFLKHSQQHFLVHTVPKNNQHQFFTRQGGMQRSCENQGITSANILTQRLTPMQHKDFSSISDHLSLDYWEPVMHTIKRQITGCLALFDINAQKNWGRGEGQEDGSGMGSRAYISMICQFVLHLVCSFISTMS